ncbi:MAG: hypothetical protein JWN73_859 [Betaproteobacteria bacterium]|nr:hypothetical protein [Betaproteobacteria bacterium]
MNAALLLVPDFALIALGWMLARWFLETRDFWAGLERLIYFVLFPPLLFTSIAQANLNLPGVAGAAILEVLVVLIGVALAHTVAVFSGAPRITGHSCAQCAYRFNSYVAIALSQQVFGQTGLALTALIIALTVPVGNIAAVTALSRGTEVKVLGQLLRNPLIIATVGGLAFNLGVIHGLGLDFPEPIWVFLKRLGSASVALGLIAVGASLRFSTAKYAKLIFSVLAVKHVAMPLAALGLAVLFDLSGVARGTAILFAAYPTASSAYILAARMGGDAESAAVTVSLSTVIGIVTLPFWVAYLT